jgi:transcriptional regulator with XRE-family HTH domain
MHQVLKNIRILRKIKGYSQDYIAKKMGITQSSYARFENQGVKIDFNIIEQVADVLEMDICTIINYHNSGSKKESEVVNSDQRELLKKLNHYADRNAYLQKMNEQFQKQVKDKEHIIELLKQQSKVVVNN